MSEQRVREIVKEELQLFLGEKKEAVAGTTTFGNCTVHGRVILNGAVQTSIQHESTSDKTKHEQA